jgi:hypothetical protein
LERYAIYIAAFLRINDYVDSEHHQLSSIVVHIHHEQNEEMQGK